MKRIGNTAFAGILAILLLVVTFCVYFLGEFEKTAVTAWALAFVLLAELVLFGGIFLQPRLRTDSNRVFVRTGLTTALILYFVAATACSLLSGAFGPHLNRFILVQVLILAAAVAAGVLLLAFSQRVNDTDSALLAQRRTMELCEQKLAELKTDPRNQSYRAQLDSLYETVHFCDKIGNASADGEILDETEALSAALSAEPQSEVDIGTALQKLGSLLEMRKLELSQEKRGAF